MDHGDTRHRLLAIVAADAAGYSRLMTQDAERTVRALEIARAAFRRHIAMHGGRVIDTAGDSVLAVLDNAIGAVEAALAVQSELNAAAAQLPEDQRLLFRIGVHLCDVIEKADGTVYGDGVNIAARLQGLAQPGDVSASESIRAAVKGISAAQFEDKGKHYVKNVADAVHMFRVERSAATGKTPSMHRSVKISAGTSIRGVVLVTTAIVGVIALTSVIAWPFLGDTNASPQTTVDLSLAVLPFRAAPADAAQAGRLTQALTTALGQWHYARVADRGLVVGYGIGATDSRAIARELGVRYLVVGEYGRTVERVRPVVDEGGVPYVSASEFDRTGDRVYAAARLIDGPTGTQVWNEEIELSTTGSTAAETEVLFRVRLSRRIRASLDAAERKRVGPGAPPMTVLQLVWRGDAALAREPIGLTGIAAAQKRYDEALARDPDFVYGIVAKGRTINARLEATMSPAQAPLTAELEALSRRAVSLDAQDPAAWGLRATALGWLGQWDEALAAVARAQDMDPSDLAYATGRAGLLLSMGRASEVEALAERLVALDPGEPQTFRVLCQSRVLAGHHESAVPPCEQVGGLEPRWLDQVFLVAAYAQVERADRAAAAKAALLRSQPEFTIGRLAANRRSGQQAYLRQMDIQVLPALRKAGLGE